jgi:hypothetical protein
MGTGQMKECHYTYMFYEDTKSFTQLFHNLSRITCIIITICWGFAAQTFGMFLKFTADSNCRIRSIIKFENPVISPDVGLRPNGRTREPARPQIVCEASQISSNLSNGPQKSGRHFGDVFCKH